MVRAIDWACVDISRLGTLLQGGRRLPPAELATAVGPASGRPGAAAAAGMGALCRHSALVRLSLGACGRLTLTGLLQPGRLWRLVTALPLGCFALLVLAAAVGHLRGSLSIWEVLVGANIFNFLLQTGTVFGTFVWHRAGLRQLQTQLEALERRAGVSSSSEVGAGRLVQLQAAVFWLLAVSFLVFWIFYERATSQEHEHVHFVHAWIPEALQSQPWSYLVYGFQLLVLFVGTCFMGTFDSCYFLWMKAATWHVRVITATLQRACQDPLNDDDDDDVEAGSRLKTDTPPGSQQIWMSDDQTVRAATDTARAEWQEESPPTSWWLKLSAGALGGGRVTPGRSLLVARPAAEQTPPAPSVTDRAGPGDPSTATLQELTQYYDDVSRFVSSVDRVTGLPSLVIHASTMLNILLDSYLVLRLVLRLDGTQTTAHLLSYSVELCLFVYRLVAYSLGGDAVSRGSAALRQALVDAPWQRLTSRASRHREELLLKLQHPLSVEPLGFFTVRKGNLLSMTGLFLTYFVIIIQMVQMAEVDSSCA